MSAIETGLRLMVDSGCRVGVHVFVTGGDEPAGSELRSTADYCGCGLMVWEPGSPCPVPVLAASPSGPAGEQE